MRKIKLLLLFAVLISYNASGQTYRIDTSEISFENKLRACLFVTYDADARTVKKAGDHFLKKNYDIRMKGVGLFSDKNLISAKDVRVAAITDKRMDLYTRLTDVADGSEMKYFMSFGYDFFIGPQNYATEFSGMKKLLNDFSIQFLNDYYSTEASKMAGQIKRLERDIKNKDKQISKNNKKSNKLSDAGSSALEVKNNA
ncbi:MAG: hypothetical protein ACSLE0_09175 [Chitinophagaceae bacterium]